MKIIHSEEKYPVVFTGASPNWIAPSTRTEAVPDGKPFKDLTDDEIPIAMDELAKEIVPKGLKYGLVEGRIHD